MRTSTRVIKKTLSPLIVLTRYGFLLFIRLFIQKIEGLENIPRQKPYILASNHVNSLDAFFLVAAIMPKRRQMIHFISKIAPWGKFWRDVVAQHWAEVIPFDEQNKEQCLRIAMDWLKAGDVVAIFPEGKPNKLATLEKAKTGAARLALWSRFPVVPVGFYNKPGWTRREIIKNALLRRAPITVKIGKPLTFDDVYDRGVSKLTLEDVSRRVMTAIGALCNKPYPY